MFSIQLELQETEDENKILASVFLILKDKEYTAQKEVSSDEIRQIVDEMNNLDSKARERSKALSKLQKENEQLKQQNEFLKKRCDEYWEESGLNSDY